MIFHRKHKPAGFDYKFILYNVNLVGRTSLMLLQMNMLRVIFQNRKPIAGHCLLPSPIVNICIIEKLFTSLIHQQTAKVTKLGGQIDFCAAKQDHTAPFFIYFKSLLNVFTKWTCTGLLILLL